MAHLASGLKQTLEYLKFMLKPKGKLCIVEYTFSPVWTNLIWGLLPGWWEDENTITPKPCLLTQQKWREALIDADFKIIHTLPIHHGETSNADACLFIVEAEQKVVN